MSSDVFSLVNVRVTVNRKTLEQIVDLLKIPTQADRNRILRSGVVTGSGGTDEVPVAFRAITLV
jgi:hypothetical protein